MGWDCNVGASVDLGGSEPFWVEVFDQGHTFNVMAMFKEAGAVPPRDWNDRLAGDLIETLENNLALFAQHRTALEALNPANGWGSYQSAVTWQQNLLDACRRAPKAKVTVT